MALYLHNVCRATLREVLSGTELDVLTDRHTQIPDLFFFIKYWRTPAVANRTTVNKHHHATRTKARKLNIRPVFVGAHLYQPLELDCKSSPCRSDNVMILNGIALGM